MGRRILLTNRRDLGMSRELPKHTALQHTPPARNQQLVGGPGSGKSVEACKISVETADLNDRFQLDVDFHGTTIAEKLGHLIERGHESRVELIDLSQAKKLPGTPLIRRPKATDRGEWFIEEDYIVESVGQILTRDQVSDTNPHPMQGQLRGTWIRNCLRVWMRQNEDVSPLLIPYLFVYDHPLQHYLLEHCWDKKLVAEVAPVVLMHSAMQRENVFGSGKRPIDKFFSFPAVHAMLSAPPVDWLDWMLQKKIVHVSSNKMVSETVARGVFGALILLTYQTSTAYHARTGQTVKADIQVEEAGRLRPGAVEADIGEQGRKMDLGITYVQQYLPDTEDQRRVNNTTEVLKIYKLNDDVAAEAISRQASTLIADTRKVKDRTLRERTILRGYRREEMERVSTTKRGSPWDSQKTETSGTQIIQTPEFETITDETITYESLQEQFFEIRKQVRKHGTGYRTIVRGGAVVLSEYVVPLESTCSGDERQQMATEARERILSRSHYHTPDFSPPTVPKEESPPPTSETNGEPSSRSKRRSKKSQSTDASAPSAADRFRGKKDGTS